MNSTRLYVRENSDSSLHVGASDISLASVVIAFQQGHSPETIQQSYPSLTLEEVYGAITYYLANEAEVARYLDRQNDLWQQIERESSKAANPVVARLRNLARAAKTATP